MLYDDNNADWFSENSPPVDMQAGDDGVFRSVDPGGIQQAMDRGGVVGRPGIPAPNLPPHSANAGNLDALYQEWTQSHGSANANMQDFADFLTQNGVQASVARHGVNGSLASEDKLIINGKVADFITNAGPNGQWGGINWDNGGGDGGGVGQYGGSFNQTTTYPEWTKHFQAPTLAEAQQTPGYQFAQSQGEDAILRNAAKMGIARTGGTLKDVSDFNTNLANRAYGDIYSRALQDYNTELGSYLTNYGRARDVLGDQRQNFLTNYGIYSDNFNRDQGAQDQAFRQQYSLADLGLRATTGQSNLYTGYGTNVANIYTTGANNQSNLATQQGNAAAAGQVGSANAYQTGLGNIGGDVTSLILNNQGRGVYRRPTGPGQDY